MWYETHEKIENTYLKKFSRKNAIFFIYFVWLNALGNILHYYLHKQSLCDSMVSLFFQPKSQILLRQNVFILKLFLLIKNKLLSTANAKNINTDYCITNSTLASRYHGSVA